MVYLYRRAKVDLCDNCMPWAILIYRTDVQRRVQLLKDISENIDHQTYFIHAKTTLVDSSYKFEVAHKIWLITR